MLREWEAFFLGVECLLIMNYEYVSKCFRSISSCRKMSGGHLK